MQNIPISRITLKEKSLEISSWTSNFNLNKMWSQKFNLRHDLTFIKMCGEAADVYDCVYVNSECVQISWLFNFYECEVFFNFLPDKTVSYRNNKFNGVKNSNGRLFILLAVNIGSFEKITPIIMDIFLKPRSLKPANIPMYFTMQIKTRRRQQAFRDKKLNRIG